jgi:hypothetical protein
MCGCKCVSGKENGATGAGSSVVVLFLLFRENPKIKLSAFRPRGVPGLTSKLSPRVPAQMGRRETEHEGGRNSKRGNPRPSCCPAPRSGALVVGGLQASARESERGRERLSASPFSRTANLLV